MAGQKKVRSKIRTYLVNQFASRYKDQDQELMMQVFDAQAGEIIGTVTQDIKKQVIRIIDDEVNKSEGDVCAGMLIVKDRMLTDL